MIMFSEKLQKLRKERGVSQEELSEILNVSRQSISKYENGTSEPNFEKLLILSKYFNVSLDELLDNTIFQNSEQGLVVKNIQSNKILIESKIDGKVSSFYKFINSSVFGKKEHHPEMMLLGVDGHSFWGDNAVALAWYATKNDYEKELQAIMEAMSKGEAAYHLKYYVNVKKKGIFDLEIIR